LLAFEAGDLQVIDEPEDLLRSKDVAPEMPLLLLRSLRLLRRLFLLANEERRMDFARKRQLFELQLEQRELLAMQSAAFEEALLRAAHLLQRIESFLAITSCLLGQEAVVQLLH